MMIVVARQQIIIFRLMDTSSDCWKRSVQLKAEDSLTVESATYHFFALCRPHNDTTYSIEYELRRINFHMKPYSCILQVDSFFISCYCWRCYYLVLLFSTKILQKKKIKTKKNSLKIKQKAMMFASTTSQLGNPIMTAL